MRGAICGSAPNVESEQKRNKIPMNSFARAEVRAHNGVPTIFVNDEPLHGMTATSVAFDDPEVVRGFVEGGVEIMMIWIEAPLKCWRGPGQYDWSYAEEKLRFFEEHAGDTKWLIRVRLGLVADWWGRAHPGEAHSVQEKMTAAVIHSPQWLQDVAQAVADFVDWLRTTRWASRIIGFMLNAGSTEEWLPFDCTANARGQYHAVVAREFRRWLQREYSDERALRAAWRDENAAFETATPPRGMARHGSHIWGLFTLRDPQHDRPAIDYYRYLNHTLADALIHLCRTAKQSARTPVLCGGFHSYLWWETGVYSYIQEYGHGLIQKLNASEWIDFVSDITSYDGRYPGGPSGYLGLPHSLNLNRKLHYTEVDLTTHLNMSAAQRTAWSEATTEQKSQLRPGEGEPILRDRAWKWSLNFCGRDEAETIAVLQREAAHNLITGTPYWWFDIKARSYRSPGLVDALRRLSDIGKRSVTWDRSTRSQVAFVCSEETPFFQSSMDGELLRFQMEMYHPLLLDGCNKKWGLAGVPYDTYELHDLAHPDFPGEQYKLLIFVNCAKVSTRAAEGIRRWQKDGRALCWTFAAACLDEDHFDPALGEELIGLRLNCRRARRALRIEVRNDDHVLTRGGAALNFGTEGAVGPVFFADDERAQVLGALRDGEEAGFAVREHSDWRSAYLALPNFGPQLLRNLAEYSGAHVWCESNDVIYANRSLLCLHTASAGHKTIRLPCALRVTDLWSGAEYSPHARQIEVEAAAYRTLLWRLEESI
jgi:hypothetical protein